MRTSPKFVPPAGRADYPPRCSICGGAIVERAVTLYLPDRDGETRTVDHVPAGVCDTCGEQYLKSAVIRRVEKLVQGLPTRRREVPVWDFDGSA